MDIVFAIANLIWVSCQVDHIDSAARDANSIGKTAGRKKPAGAGFA
jgi:hypothetical protein